MPIVAHRGLRDRAVTLGLCMSVWDADCTQAEPAERSCEFCDIICQAGGGCDEAVRGLVRYVLDTREPSRQTGPAGCCMFALPIFDRRRLVGVVVLSYPTREMMDEEHIARVSDKLQLDGQVMLKFARLGCRHSAAEAGHFQNLFSQLLSELCEASETSGALDSLSVNLASTYEVLSMLYNISGSMVVSQEPGPFLQGVCDQLRDVLGVSLASALVYDERTRLDGDIVVTSAADENITSQQLRLLAASHLATALAGQESFLLDNHFDQHEDMPAGQGIKNILAAPLIIDRHQAGVLVAMNKTKGDFDSFDAKFLSAIAAQASVFLTNNRMYAELQEMLMGVLHSLTESIDAKDPYTCGHSRRVAALARRLAIDLGFDEARVKEVYLAGLLHDVGKIGVAEAILCKDGKLTDEEYDSMKRHPEIGARILRRISHLQPVLSGVVSHHERIDGRGYPNKLAGEDVPIEGRIIGLADSWDAMTSHRTYRRALSVDRAKEEISRCSGTQFDPALAKILLSWDLEAFMVELHSNTTEDLILQ